jgi:hypothetical protein
MSHETADSIDSDSEPEPQPSRPESRIHGPLPRMGTNATVRLRARGSSPINPIKTGLSLA